MTKTRLTYGSWLEVTQILEWWLEVKEFKSHIYPKWMYGILDTVGSKPKFFDRFPG